MTIKCMSKIICHLKVTCREDHNSSWMALCILDSPRTEETGPCLNGPSEAQYNHPHGSPLQLEKTPLAHLSPAAFQQIDPVTAVSHRCFTFCVIFDIENKIAAPQTDLLCLVWGIKKGSKICSWCFLVKNSSIRKKIRAVNPIYLKIKGWAIKLKLLHLLDWS